MIKGIDISHFQAPFPWDRLSKEVKFVYCKATQGASYKDPEFNGYWQHLKGTDLKRGAYHFLTVTDSAEEQAKNFLSRGIDFSKPGVLPPVLDIEDQVGKDTADTNRLNRLILNDKAAFIKKINDWIAIVEKATGRKVMIYSYKNFFAEYLNNHSWPNNPLWLASYQLTPPGLPKGYTKWDMWQNSDRGTLAGKITGGALDLDYFNGTENELNYFSNIKY